MFGVEHNHLKRFNYSFSFLFNFLFRKILIIVLVKYIFYYFFILYVTQIAPFIPKIRDVIPLCYCLFSGCT